MAPQRKPFPRLFLSRWEPLRLTGERNGADSRAVFGKGKCRLTAVTEQAQGLLAELARHAVFDGVLARTVKTDGKVAALFEKLEARADAHLVLVAVTLVRGQVTEVDADVFDAVVQDDGGIWEGWAEISDACLRSDRRSKRRRGRTHSPLPPVQEF